MKESKWEVGCQAKNPSHEDLGLNADTQLLCRRLNASGNPSHEDLGLNADTQLLTRGASGWQPKVFIKTFG